MGEYGVKSIMGDPIGHTIEKYYRYICTANVKMLTPGVSDQSVWVVSLVVQLGSITCTFA